MISTATSPTVRSRPGATPVLERGLKWVRRRPTISSLLAVACLILSIGAVAWLRAASIAMKPGAPPAGRGGLACHGESILTRARNDLIDGRFPIDELSSL